MVRSQELAVSVDSAGQNSYNTMITFGAHLKVYINKFWCVLGKCDLNDKSS